MGRERPGFGWGGRVAVVAGGRAEDVSGKAEVGPGETGDRAL